MGGNEWQEYGEMLEPDLYRDLLHVFVIIIFSLKAKIMAVTNGIFFGTFAVYGYFFHV